MHVDIASPWLFIHRPKKNSSAFRMTFHSVTSLFFLGETGGVPPWSASDHDSKRYTAKSYTETIEGLSISNSLICVGFFLQRQLSTRWFQSPPTLPGLVWSIVFILLFLYLYTLYWETKRRFSIVMQTMTGNGIGGYCLREAGDRLEIGKETLELEGI